MRRIRGHQRVLVINPNMALDRVLVVKPHALKQSLKPVEAFLWAGGSATHAAHVIHTLGGCCHVVGFKGGGHGRILKSRLQAQGIPHTLVTMRSETRCTVSVLTKGKGNLFDIAEFGGPVSEVEVESYWWSCLRLFSKASMAIFSGSLPSGFSTDFYVKVVLEARKRGIPSMGDVYGRPLDRVLGARPGLIKVSRPEMERWMGHRITSLERAARAVCRMQEAGAEHVVLSLDAGGGVARLGDKTWHIRHPAVTPYNTIGCGDTLFGAMAQHYSQTSDWEESVRVGFAAALGNLFHDQPGHCTSADLRRWLPKIKMKIL